MSRRLQCLSPQKLSSGLSALLVLVFGVIFVYVFHLVLKRIKLHAPLLRLVAEGVQGFLQLHSVPFCSHPVAQVNVAADFLMTSI